MNGKTELMFEISDGYCTPCVFNHDRRCTSCAVFGMIDTIENVLPDPVVTKSKEDEHVVHAYPIFDHISNYAKCSNCKRYTIGYDVDNWDSYCSHCGAKLDGERKDGEQDAEH